MPVLQVAKLSETATLPCKGSAQSIGFDLFAAQSFSIGSKCRQLVKTGIAVTLPEGTYGRVAPRSGLALKHGIDIFGGVIDPDYRGDVGVILVNMGPVPFEVGVGDRIAQLILEKAEQHARVVQVPSLADLGVSARGNNGFGSTGV